MDKRVRVAAGVAAAVLLCGCSTVTTISSTNPGTILTLKDKTVSLPYRPKLKGTSFGNYEFEAEDAGSKPMYGILPLKFKGGHLAVDILFFAPAAFFNLRSVFPFYQIDVEHGIIRYKNAAGDDWIDYVPKPEEAARARAFFTQQHPVAKTDNTQQAN